MNADEDDVSAELERRRAQREKQQTHQRRAELASETARLMRQLELLRDFEERMGRELRTNRITKAVYDEQQQHALRQRIDINDELAVLRAEQTTPAGQFVLERRPATVYHERELLTEALQRLENEQNSGPARGSTREELIAKYTQINEIIDAILLVMLREYDDTELQIKNLKTTEADMNVDKKVRTNAQRTRIAREAYLQQDWPQQRAALEQKRQQTSETIRRLRLKRDFDQQPSLPVARRNRRGERILFARDVLDIDDSKVAFGARRTQQLLPVPNFDDDL